MFADWPRLELPRPGGPPETYVLELFATSKALEWQQRLANFGLEPLAMMLSERELPWSSAFDADLVVLSKTIIAKVNAEGLALFLTQLLSGVYLLRQAEHGIVAEPLAKDFEHRFRGRSLDVYRLAGWVLQENFRDFIVGVRWIGEALRARLNGASPMPSTPMPSTDSSTQPLPT